MQDVRRLINQAIRDSRSLIFELSPPILYELGLVAALEWLAEQFCQQHQMTCEFRGDGRDQRLPENLEVVLFQAVRELLVNVAKHARAKKAEISVSRTGGNFLVKVDDNGVGFDDSLVDSASGRHGGFGLFSIRERLTHLGGTLAVDSRPGVGTRITLVAPLDDHKPGYREEE